MVDIESSQITLDPMPSRWTRLTNVIGDVGGVILKLVGFIISIEIASVIAFWTWRTFGPLSLFVTFEFWLLVPFWYGWRWFIGLLTGWGWPV